jgi:hypothetical protein
VILAESQYGFVFLLAQRSFDHEGVHTSPEVAARDHIALRQRIQADRMRSDPS